MKRIRFIMIGGFLGAGKTTTIARLAHHYIENGQKVGLVTNDQAYDLVDTQSLRAQGFQVGEVPGACFCCKFNDLIETIAQLSETEVPEIIIAEPVGSCTDLVATVLEPLRHLHGDQYEIGPLAVLLKPDHGKKILRQEEKMGFSPKAAYIFLKQIEEADVIVINKVDTLGEDDLKELVSLVQSRFPEKKVISMSATQGTSFPDLIAAVEQPTQQPRKTMDVDYDIYAEGEAELGWLNCSVQLTHPDGVSFDLDELLIEMVEHLKDGLAKNSAEAAHLKVLGQAQDETAIANLVSSSAAVELSRSSGVKTSSAELIVNARVATSPELLEELTVNTISSIAEKNGLKHKIVDMQRFRPGRPEPTHRMTSSSSIS